jgi:predicted ATPase/class 3 adenylate cyclase
VSADQVIAPSGVVTFLFTDVEGSTRRWETNAEAMKAALAAHDDVLRAAIESHGGWLFKHTGDGVCAAFALPRSAVDAAVTAQRALELPVRMGLATGEAELRGADYFGAVLNRAARVMGAGHGGQILLADSTAVLVNGVDLLDLGPRRLRDLPTAVGMFQVRASGLRTDFPPLRTLDTTPGNLRPAPSRFIGRESELDQVAAELRSHRLVTLTGVGGVGKTRLATEVAPRLADEFPDGVWLFELAPVGDPAAVPDAVAAILGVTQQPGKSMSESVATALDGRVRLLVIDNCEHVRDAAGDLIEAILARSATVKILATSREGLGVADEQLWPVPSLDVSAGIDSAAAALFLERARTVGPSVPPANPDEESAVVEICRRLDGIPLGIELAASRMVSMTAREVRDRLDHRFRLLTGARRGQERHQTLRHAVAWSYDLLDDAEKQLLNRCSVFAGGFDLQSACAIAKSGDVDEYAILDLLDALVRKSLLVADRSTGQTRFSMLETIRQFGEEQLTGSGAADQTRAAHAAYCADCATDMLALWDGPRQRETYTWLTTEFANLRAAFRWSAATGDLDSAATLATHATSLGVWIEQYEPVAWAEELIEPARSVNHRRLLQLYVVAAQCYAAGRADDACAYLEASQKLTGSADFDPDFHESQTSSGIAYMAAGRPQRWVEVCREAIARGPGPRTITRASLVMALNFLGDADGTKVAAEGLPAAAEATTNPTTACFALFAHGIAHLHIEPDVFYDASRRALAIAQDSGNRQMEAGIAVMLSMAASTRDDPSDSLDHLTLAIRHYYDAGSVSLMHNPLAILVGVFDRLGHHEQAATISGFAASPMARAGYPQLDAAVTHLREILGDKAYESFAHAGETMTIAAIATYALANIEHARTALEAPQG